MEWRKSLPIIGIFLFILLTSKGISEAQDLTFLDENDVGVHYYDRASIKKTAQGNLLVLIIQFPTQAMVEAIQEISPNAKGLFSMWTLYEVDCRKKVYKINKMFYLNKNNQLIYDSTKEKRKYRPMDFRAIPQGTVADRMSQFICH